MRRMGHVPALDGLRGIAIALVMLAHGFSLGGGVLGVDLFFVLSGFLITTILLEEHESRGCVSLRDFFRRRAARLLPALIVMLGILTIAALVIRGPAAAGRITIHDVVAIGYASNIALVVDPSAVSIYLKHLWSLAAEEQFYAVWPIVLVGMLRWAPRSLQMLLVVATTASVLDLYLFPWSAAHRYTGPDTHASPILLGCLAAVMRARGTRVTASMGATAFAGAAVIAVAASSTGTGIPLYPIFAAFCAVGVLHVAETETSRTSRLLTRRELVWLGGISYSLYLWHFPLLLPGGAPWLSYPVAVWLAIISTTFVERPLIRRYRRRRETLGANTPPVAAKALS